MRAQNALKAFAASAIVSFLVACGGTGLGTPASSTSTGTTTGSSTTGGTSGGTSGTIVSGSTPSATPVNLSVVAAAGTIDSSGNTEYVITASVTDIGHAAVSNSTVDFSLSSSANISTVKLSQTSAVSDTNGDAEVTLTVMSGQAAGTINIQATDANVSSLTAMTSVVISAPSNLQLGVLATDGIFTPKTIAIGQTPLAAGGSSALSVYLVDTANGNAPYTTSTSVSFTSPCITNGTAAVTTPVTSTNGLFTATYVAKGCVGGDLITATASVAGSPIASNTITVTAPSLGSIQFTSPTGAVTIGLKGTGLNETQTVTFTVFDSNGNPVPNQAVVFSLSTSVGGLALTNTSATSNSSGVVSTIVNSGTVHTTVRVIATATKSDGTVLTTQSDQITVSTGFPAQNGMSISATTLNLIGDDYDGNTTTVTVRMSDRYNNPVPDGTAVAFTTECGGIDSSCTTTGGACDVTFTTKNPRTSMLVANGMAAPASGGTCPAAGSTDANELGCDDHRCTVLATAIGEESYNDCNGTGNYVSAANPANDPSQCPNGDLFVSLPEAWVDSNENGVFNGNTETPIDFNQNGKWDPAPADEFTGLLCAAANGNCTTATSLNTRQSIVIIMTSSGAGIGFGGDPQDPKTSYTIPVNGEGTVVVRLFDSAGQPPPAGTTVKFALKSNGTVVPASISFGSTDAFGEAYVNVIVEGAATAGSDLLVVTATTPAPGNIVSVGTIPITYQ